LSVLEKLVDEHGEALIVSKIMEIIEKGQLTYILELSKEVENMRAVHQKEMLELQQQQADVIDKRAELEKGAIESKRSDYDRGIEDAVNFILRALEHTHKYDDLWRMKWDRLDTYIRPFPTYGPHLDDTSYTQFASVVCYFFREMIKDELINIKETRVVNEDMMKNVLTEARCVSLRKKIMKIWEEYDQSPHIEEKSTQKYQRIFNTDIDGNTPKLPEQEPWLKRFSVYEKKENENVNLGTA